MGLHLGSFDGNAIFSRLGDGQSSGSTGVLPVVCVQKKWGDVICGAVIPRHKLWIGQFAVGNSGAEDSAGNGGGPVRIGRDERFLRVVEACFFEVSLGCFERGERSKAIDEHSWKFTTLAVSEAGYSRHVDVVAIRVTFNVTDKGCRELIAAIVVSFVITADGVVEVLLMNNRDVFEGKRHHEVHVFSCKEVLASLLRGAVVCQDADVGTIGWIDDVVGV